jgi:hypothetical protein
MRTFSEDGKDWPAVFLPKGAGDNALIGYPYPIKRIAYPLSLLTVAFIFFSIHFSFEWFLSVPLGLLLLLMAVSVTQTVVVNCPEGKAQVHVRFFMRWTLQSKSISFKKFKAIVYTLYENSDEGPKKRVGLLHDDGRKFWIRGYACDGTKRGSSRFAEEFAWRLSCDTGIPIEEKII